MRRTISWTWSFSARPDPVTAALTSLGVCMPSGRPARAAATMASPATCAVPMTERTLCWANTRSTATASTSWVTIHSSMPAEMVSRRCWTGMSGGVRRTPTATAGSSRRGPESTTPSPQRVRPGSTPRTRMRPVSQAPPTCRGSDTAGDRRAPSVGVELGEDLVGRVEVGEDVLHVVAVLQGVDELDDLARPLDVHLDLHRGHELRLGGVVLQAGVLQRGAHGDDVARVAEHLEALAEVGDLLRTCVEDGTEDVVLREAVGLGDEDGPAPVEQVGHRARVGEGAAVTGEGHADVGGRAVAVVGEALDEHGHPAGRVALVHDGLVVGTARLGP